MKDRYLFSWIYIFFVLVWLCIFMTFTSCEKAPAPDQDNCREWSDIVAPMWPNFSEVDTSFPGMGLPSMEIWQQMAGNNPHRLVYIGYEWTGDGYECATSPGYWPNVCELLPSAMDGWWVKLSHPVTGEKTGHLNGNHFDGVFWLRGIMDQKGNIEWK